MPPSLRPHVSLILLILLLSFISSTTTVLCEDPHEKFLSIYDRVVDLALKGIDVHQYVSALNEALQLLESNKSGEAVELMNRIDSDLRELESRAGNIVFTKTLSKYATATAILSLPVIVYFLLPRLYIYVWFRSRRRWVLVNERNKR